MRELRASHTHESLSIVHFPGHSQIEIFVSVLSYASSPLVGPPTSPLANMTGGFLACAKLIIPPFLTHCLSSLSGKSNSIYFEATFPLCASDSWALS